MCEADWRWMDGRMEKDEIFSRTSSYFPALIYFHADIVRTINKSDYRDKSLKYSSRTISGSFAYRSKVREGKKRKGKKGKKKHEKKGELSLFGVSRVIG